MNPNLNPKKKSQGAMEVNPAPKSSMRAVAEIAKYRSKRVL